MEKCREYRNGQLASAFIISDGGLLVLERSEQGYLDVPSVRLEAGETPEEAVERAFINEFQVTVLALGELACLRRQWRWPDVQAHVVAVEIVLGRPQGVHYASQHELRGAQLSPELERLTKMVNDGDLSLHEHPYGGTA